MATPQPGEVFVPVPRQEGDSLVTEMRPVTAEELDDMNFLTRVVCFDLDLPIHVFRAVDEDGLKQLRVFATEKGEDAEVDYFQACLAFGGREALRHTVDLKAHSWLAA